MTDLELLNDYASSQSEGAFTALVKRYAGLVYSAALRQTGNRQFAEDITQAVFIILAQKAGKFHKTSVLSGWLLRTTYFVAANARRKDFHRLKAEQLMAESYTTDTDLAWKAIAPILDEALFNLNETDRNAVSLRFFEGKSYKEVADAMGTSAGTAQKRVSRALELLRLDFRRRGLIVPTALIAGAVGTHGVQAATGELLAIVGRAAMGATGHLGTVPALVKTTLEASQAAWRRTMMLRTGAAAMIFLTAILAQRISVSKKISNVNVRAPVTAAVVAPTTTNPPAIAGPSVVGRAQTGNGGRAPEEPLSTSIYGTVVDVETHQAIPDFEVWMGANLSNALANNPFAIVGLGLTLQTNGKDGTFSSELPRFPHVLSYNFEIRAKGFYSAQLSVPAPLTEASHLNFELERAPMIEGMVLAPDNTPAGDAIVVLSSTNDYVRMQGPGQLEIYASGGARGIRSVTDANGHFAAQVSRGANRVFVANAAGYFQASLGQFAASKEITLEPWGRIEGTLRIGNQPGSNQTIQLDNGFSPAAGASFNVLLSAKTDSDGHFVLDKVPPGQWEVGRVVRENRSPGGYGHAPDSVFSN